MTSKNIIVETEEELEKLKIKTKNIKKINIISCCPYVECKIELKNSNTIIVKIDPDKGTIMSEKDVNDIITQFDNAKNIEYKIEYKIEQLEKELKHLKKLQKEMKSK